MQGNGPYVALVAVASNEAAYLADWVFHHLRFGFGPIELHVNRSTDGTEALARQLAAHVPQLRVVNVDHFDQGPEPTRNIQRAAYSEARPRLRRALSRRDYQMYLDVDEYWTPGDFTSTIQEVLGQAGWPSIAAFNWFMQRNEDAPFAPPFAVPPAGAHNRHVKTAFRAHLRAMDYTVHSIRPWWPVPSWSASGGRLTLRQRNRTQTAPERFGAGFVLHRFCRSPLEYLSILARMDARNADVRFKKNRAGFHAEQASGPQDAFAIAPEALAAYQGARAAFVAKTGVGAMLAEGQRIVTERAARVLKTYRAMPDAERDEWADKFAGLDLEALWGKLEGRVAP